jgi:peptidoglycan/LPS O-acetylase OafA/YrhL
VGRPEDDRGGNRSASHLPYRPEIDGLRALAVVPVVLNHFDVRGFSGGYVGVDIFFVISGFLITDILVRDLTLGRHSIGEFYRRRILRIFPALFAMMAVTTVLACVALLPVELARFARSLLAATFFGSNVLFYSQSGYFDVVSSMKPLLHTWSLAVEEQFYILWPLMLAAIGGRRRLMGVSVLLVTLASFALASAFVRTDANAAFYLLPFRAWELGLGALLAIYRPVVRPGWPAELIGAAGLMAIAATIILYDEYTMFPGPAAALPCFGAAALIVTGPASPLSARALSARPLVFTGRISYSLYLWHWPVVVFTKIGLLLAVAGPLVKAAEVAASVLLAVLSWRFVEQPFRTGNRRWSTRRVLAGGGVTMALASAVALALLVGRGLPARFTADEVAIGRYLDVDGERLYRRGTCFRLREGAPLAPFCLERRTERPALLLLGDSHAAHLWPGLAQVDGGHEILQATMAGCRPVLRPEETKLCQRFFNMMLLDWAPRHPTAGVLLAANWRPADLPFLERTLADPRVRRLNPVVIGPIPQYTAALPRLMVEARRRNDPELVQRSFLPVAARMEREVAAIAARHGVPYVSLVAALCHGLACRTEAAPRVPMQFDYSHLTGPGSAVVAAAMLPGIEAAVRGR